MSRLPPSNRVAGFLAAKKGGADVVDRLPALLVLILSAVAVATSGMMPAAPVRKGLRMSGVALLAGLAAAATLWQARSAADRISAEQIHSAALTNQIQALKDQIDTLRESTRWRTIKADTAASLANYLRPFGVHQVMVSCSPNDIEAFHYATKIVNTLKS
jgi:hypothetical protein